MKTENAIRVMAGSMVLLSLGLYYFHSENWLFLTAFVGVNLIQSAFTGFCPAEMVFKRCGMKSGSEPCCKE